MWCKSKSNNFIMKNMIIAAKQTFAMLIFPLLQVSLFKFWVAYMYLNSFRVTGTHLSQRFMLTYI